MQRPSAGGSLPISPAVQALLDTSRFVCSTLEPTRYGLLSRTLGRCPLPHRKQFPLVALVKMNKDWRYSRLFCRWLNKPGSAKRYGLELERS